MSGLESLKTFIKENKLLSFIVLAGLAIIIIIGLFGGGEKPPPPAVPSEVVAESFGTLPPAPNIPSAVFQATPSAVASFLDATKISLPTTARVYSFSQTSTLSLDTVDKLAVRLGFSRKPIALPGGKFNWDEGTSFLHYDSALDGMVFSLNNLSSTPSASSASKAEAVTSLLNYLGLNYPDLVIKDTNPTQNTEGLTTFLVPRFVDTLEVSSLPFDPALVSFDFNSAGQLVGGVYYHHMLQSGSQSYGVYPLKTVDEALADLTSGRGTLAQIGLDSYDAVDITGISAASITGVKLMYHESRIPEKFLRPVYAFTGTVSLRDGRTSTATYFVDALQ